MHKLTLSFLFGLLLCSVGFAEEYYVSGERVNFRSSASFSGEKNVIKVLTEGDRLIMTKEHDNYIEATLVPDGTKGFIWKDYVEAATTHDYYKSKSNAFPTVTPDTEDPNISRSDTLSMPICGCAGCSRSSKFGIRTHPITKKRRLHAGCDIRAPKGTYVYAIADGTVKKAGVNGGYGKAIDVEHLSTLKGRDGKILSNRGYTTRYGHLWKILVTKGQKVKRGQKIGQVNTTGLSTGNHLHFEIAVTGMTIDPEKAIDISNVTKSCSTNDSEGTRSAQ
jgi:murein DD-endopeptidase MepM/ murein hydrolase activator NlpD